VADVNGDGAQDLVVADASGSAVATIFRTGEGGSRQARRSTSADFRAPLSPATSMELVLLGLGRLVGREQR
jgi:hypothetical protein